MTLLQINGVFSKFHKRGRIRGNKVFLVAKTDGKWRTETAYNKHSGEIIVHNCNSVGSIYLIQGITHCSREIYSGIHIHKILDKVYKHFSIGFRMKNKAFFGKHGLNG